MKKKGFVLLMMVFLLLSVLPTSAAEQRVFDNADLLTAEEEQNLQQFCEDAKEEYDIDFAYLTTKDTEGLSTREYGAQFYIEQNLGVGEDYSGAIFVLDMGEPVKILDLAKNLILLSGHKPYEDIQIVFTGLRPGEKLYEEMLMDEEGLQDTENNLIHIGKPIELDEGKFLEQLEELKEYVVTEPSDIREWVKKIVPTYQPKEE